MLEEITKATTSYLEKWDRLVEKRANKTFFQNLKPVSVGWKTTDLNEFNGIFLELREYCDQVHLGWVNERWLASMHLKDSKLPGDIEIIKLMQRRPNSTDPVGLDHFDFYHDSEEEIKQVLTSEADLDAAKESNNPLCHWHSIRFEDTEAKLRADTVIDVCIAELREVNKQIALYIK